MDESSTPAAEQPTAASGDDIAQEISQPVPPNSVTDAHRAEFPAATAAQGRGSLPLDRFADVNIEITAEIGRVTMCIGDLLQLGEGAVIELDRIVSEPVDVLAQGVLIARGDVVVIDDRFGIQLREIVNTDDSTAEAGARPESVPV